MKDLINLEVIVDYVFKRQNEDGGYTFCREAESNAQDTFYALKVFEMVGALPRNVDKTVRFLQGLQHDDGDFDSVKVAYYVIQSLSQLGHMQLKNLDRLHQSFDEVFAGLKNPSTHENIEIVSEIENIHLAVELLNTLDFPINTECVTKQILSLWNIDRSFGNIRNSRIASTYHALGTLKILNYDVEALRATLSWIRRCEIPSGGFVASPELLTTYLEDIYFGVKALEVLNESLRYPEETLRFIANLQNPNGGFRRSIFLGISTFESTYQALSCIKIIHSFLKRQ